MISRIGTVHVPCWVKTRLAACYSLQDDGAGHYERDANDAREVYRVAIKRVPEDDGAGRSDAGEDGVGGADRDGISAIAERKLAEPDAEIALLTVVREALARLVGPA